MEGWMGDTGVQEGKITGMAPANVARTAEGGDVGDVVVDWWKRENLYRTGHNSQVLHDLLDAAAWQVEKLGAPGQLFELRLDVVPGIFDPNEPDIGLVGEIRGVTFPCAAPNGVLANPAAGKVWMLWRASGGGPLPAGPFMENVIKYPRELGLREAIFLTPPL